MKTKFRITAAILAVMVAAGGMALGGCAKSGTESTTGAATAPAMKTAAATADPGLAELKAENDSLKKQLAAQSSNVLLYTAQNVLALIRDHDMAGLKAYVHPTKGVRFTPYSSVSLSNDVVLTQAQIQQSLFTDTQTYAWGAYDGSGLQISKTFFGYFQEFIYDHDYATPNLIGVNTIIGKGNMVNNLATAYPAGQFVEFHFTGFAPKYNGMDWASLRLIFEQYGGQLYLVGVQHDQWTI